MLKGPHKPQWKESGPPCEVCGKPRSKGIHFFDHGRCMEKLAAKAAEVKLRGNHKSVVSDEDVRMARAKRNAEETRMQKSVAFFVRGD